MAASAAAGGAWDHLAAVGLGAEEAMDDEMQINNKVSGRGKAARLCQSRYRLASLHSNQLICLVSASFWFLSACVFVLLLL